MSELGIIPFRIPSKETVKPIELDLIPDCGVLEMTRLRDENQEITARITSFGVHKSDAIALKTFGAMIFLTALLVVVGAGLQYYSIAIGICLGIIGAFVSCVAAVFASISYVKPPHEDETVRQLVARRTSQELRLAGLVSLERLTGKCEIAKALRLESAQFNTHLASLDTEVCSPADRAMIAEKRFDLARRIGDFRVKVLGATHDLAQLPNASDDRT